MRIVKLLPIVAVTLLCGAASGMAATRARHEPVVLRLKWHLVARSVYNVLADDRYVYFTTALPPQANAPEGILLDRQTSRRTPMYDPCGASPNSGVPSYGDPYLGGPWFMLLCSRAAHLYNPSTSQWTVISAPASSGQQQTCPAPPAYPGNVPPVEVGTYWIRWGCELQNISTGTVKADPVTPGGSVYDDLDVPSGVASLCSPLRYPGAPEVLSFYDGRFALTADQSGAPGAHLLRCGSRLNLTLQTPPAESIDSQAIAWATRHDIRGLFLPDLRPFLVHPPHRFGSAPAPVALSQRTLYVQTRPGGRLWSANLPQSP